MQENRVDFPAPLGPIRPMISPCATSKEMSSFASSPPNRFVTPPTVRKLTGPPPSGRIPEPPVAGSPRDDDEEAVGDEVESRTRPSDVDPRELREGNEDHGPTTAPQSVPTPPRIAISTTWIDSIMGKTECGSMNRTYCA